MEQLVKVVQLSRVGNLEYPLVPQFNAEKTTTIYPVRHFTLAPTAPATVNLVPQAVWLHAVHKAASLLTSFDDDHWVSANVVPDHLSPFQSSRPSYEGCVAGPKVLSPDRKSTRL